jgi:hypothetical protein
VCPSRALDSFGLRSSADAGHHAPRFQRPSERTTTPCSDSNRMSTSTELGKSYLVVIVSRVLATRCSGSRSLTGPCRAAASNVDTLEGDVRPHMLSNTRQERPSPFSISKFP